MTRALWMPACLLGLGLAASVCWAEKPASHDSTPACAAPYYYQLAQILFSPQSDCEENCTESHEATEAPTTVADCLRVWRALWVLGNYGEAQAVAEEACRMSPGNPAAEHARVVAQIVSHPHFVHEATCPPSACPGVRSSTCSSAPCKAQKSCCPAEATACSDKSCCAKKACACGAGCSCGKTCACGSECCCAKGSCSCACGCAKCSCGKKKACACGDKCCCGKTCKCGPDCQCKQSSVVAGDDHERLAQEIYRLLVKHCQPNLGFLPAPPMMLLPNRTLIEMPLPPLPGSTLVGLPGIPGMHVGPMPCPGVLCGQGMRGLVLPGGRPLEMILTPPTPMAEPMPAEDMPIEVTAKGSRVHIRTERFQATCDHLSYHEACDEVVLTGKVRLKIRNGSATDKISAERVEVGVHEPYFNVTPVGSPPSGLDAHLTPQTAPSATCKPKACWPCHPCE